MITRDKSTPEHDRLVQDADADPIDRGWALHLVGWDRLVHLEPDIKRLTEHEHSEVRGYAYEALLRWGKVEYLDGAIFRALEPRPAEERGIIFKALAIYAQAHQERRDDALAALTSVVEHDEDDDIVRHAYRHLVSVLSPVSAEFVSKEAFDRSTIDWALLSPYQREAAGPRTH